jgi:nitroreductase
MLDQLLKRRSAKPAMMTAPGPTADQLTQILTAGARVPDHKKLVPWRFIVIEGDGRDRLGNVLAEALATETPDAVTPQRLETERTRFTRAPLVVCVVARVQETAPAPAWEQILSAGAACFNICHAANALGFGTAWITEWYAYSLHVKKALALAPHEQIAGFIYMGTVAEAQPDRDRPNLADIVTRY